MNKERFKGILMGVMASVLAFGMGVTAFAANRSISVSDGIRIQINGQAFQPKDGNGSPVELFAYNGTVYAPVRAICEAAGMTVSYDANTKMVSVTRTSDLPAQETAPSNSVTLEEAKKIALDHAGVDPASAVFVEAKLSQGVGSAHYDIEFYSGSIEYDYEIDYTTGRILEHDHDFSNRLSSRNTATANSTITEARAREIALSKAPSGATITKCKLDHDDGLLVYEVELHAGRIEYECDIDAVTGAVLKWIVDD